MAWWQLNFFTHQYFLSKTIYLYFPHKDYVPTNGTFTAGTRYLSHVIGHIDTPTYYVWCFLAKGRYPYLNLLRTSCMPKATRKLKATCGLQTGYFTNQQIIIVCIRNITIKEHLVIYLQPYLWYDLSNKYTLYIDNKISSIHMKGKF